MSITVDPESLPLLDAFIQESMRINPSDASKAMLSERKVLSELLTNAQSAAGARRLSLSGSPTDCW